MRWTLLEYAKELQEEYTEHWNGEYGQKERSSLATEGKVEDTQRFLILWSRKSLRGKGPREWVRELKDEEWQEAKSDESSGEEWQSEEDRKMLSKRWSSTLPSLSNKCDDNDIRVRFGNSR